jgi:MFS family permease
MTISALSRAPRAVFGFYREAFSGIPAAVWWLATAALVNRAGTMVLPFLPLYLTGPRGWTVIAAGQALAFYGVGGMTGSLLGGWLIERIPAEWVMVGSLVGASVCFVVLEALRPWWLISALLFVLAVFGEAFRPANNLAIASASGPGQRAQGISLYRLAINLGMCIGPVVGGLLAARTSYPWLFRIDGATALAAAAVLSLTLRKQWVVPSRSARAEPARLLATSSAEPWSAPRLIAVLFLAFAAICVIYQIWGAFILTLRDVNHFRESQIGALFAVNTGIIVVCEMLVVRALRGFNPLHLAAAGALLVCIGLGLLPFALSLPAVALTILVWTAGEMLLIPHLGASLVERPTAWPSGRVLGFYGLTATAAWVVAPLGSSWLYQHYGPRVLCFLDAALGLPLALGFYWVSLPRRTSPPAATSASAAASLR